MRICMINGFWITSDDSFSFKDIDTFRAVIDKQVIAPDNTQFVYIK